MGAYLSKPVTEKNSSDESSGNLIYGASTMQGWRVDQEDAHNAILKLDESRSLFAVYDGHGGHEVATYAALHLPDLIKQSEAYMSNQYSQALIDAFLKFDSSLIKPEVLAVLKEVSGTQEDEDSDYDGEEVSHLWREAAMPLEEVMAKYSDDLHQFRSPNVSFNKRKVNASKSSSEGEISDCCSQSLESNLTPQIVNNNESESPSAKSDAKNEDKELSGDAMGVILPNGVNSSSDLISSATLNGDSFKRNGKYLDDGGGCEENELIEDENSKTPEADIASKESMNGVSVSKASPFKNKSGTTSDKGKSLVNYAVLQSLKVARLKERKRQAAQNAEEIYKQIQNSKETIPSEEDEDDSEDDLSYEDAEDGEDLIDESSEEEEEVDEQDEEEIEDEDVEEEEDEASSNPYQEYSTNMMSSEVPGYDSGCTACVALMSGRELYVANVGDSRCVVCRDGKAFDMSVDHKPEDELESARVAKAGGRITDDGRVNGGLNLSRALGDHSYKQNKVLSPEEQMISPLPDVRSLTLTKEDSFMVIACDGIWNSLSSQEVCDFVSARLESHEKLSTIAEEMFDHCLSPDACGDGTGCDNMTCVIVKFCFTIAPEATAKRECSSESESLSEKKLKTDDDV